jgi:hypothetical protein
MMSDERERVGIGYVTEDRRQESEVRMRNGQRLKAVTGGEQQDKMAGAGNEQRQRMSK